MNQGDMVTVGDKQGVALEIADNQRGDETWKSCLVKFENGKRRWYRVDDVNRCEDFLKHIPIPRELTAVISGDDGPRVFCSDRSKAVDAFAETIFRMWQSKRAA